MGIRLTTVLSIVLVAHPGIAQDLPGLAAPVKLLAGGQPVDIQRGHLAPFFADLAGDGVRHLLIGGPGEGKLRIYRNTGNPAEPRFDSFTFLRDGAEDGRVPAG
jgi:hypothetical protein